MQNAQEPSEKKGDRSERIVLAFRSKLRGNEAGVTGHNHNFPGEDPEGQGQSSGSQTVNSQETKATPTPPLSQAASRNGQSAEDLWAVALQKLPQDQREVVERIPEASKLNVLVRLCDEVKRKRDECEAKKWKFEFKGRQIVARDVADKIIVWVNKFKAIGDVAVQYDPVHAALPWAGIRLILEPSPSSRTKLNTLKTITVESQQTAGMLMCVEKMASMIGRCKIFELLYIEKESLGQVRDHLRTALVSSYTLILTSLARICNLYKRSSTKRAIHSILNPDEMSSFMEKCERSEKEVEKEVMLCESLCSRDADVESTERVENLKAMLMDFERPISRLDSRVASMFTALEIRKQSDILRWISPIPYQDSHMSARMGRTEGTGRWILRHTQYCEWRKSSSSTILWLHGIPGAGKTKLVSTIVDDLISSMAEDSNDEALAYFYCDRNRDEYRDPASILSSWVRQLSVSHDGKSVETSIMQLYEKHRQTGFASSRLSVKETQDQVYALTKNYPQITLVLDALDECDKSTRTDLVYFLNGLVNNSSTLLKIFISSRPDPDIRIEFKNGPNLEIKATDNYDDICKHVDSVITSATSPLFWRNRVQGELRDRVCQTLTSRSEGMFQWIALQIRQLHALSRERDVDARLGKLPTTLKRAYDEIYDRIKAGEGSAPVIADRACKWMMCAKQPMSPEMLVRAVCQDPMTEEWDIVDIDIDFVLESCQNLLKVEFDAWKEICRFSHLSVQEYLENNCIKLAEANNLVASICLKALNDIPCEENYIDLFNDRTLDPKRYERMGGYETRFWLNHVQDCIKETSSGRVIMLLKKFLGWPTESTQAYRCWYKTMWNLANAYGESQSQGQWRLYQMSALEPASLASLPAARYGFHQLGPDWWAHVDPIEQNRQGSFLLMLASSGGCAKTVQILLEKETGIANLCRRNHARDAIYSASQSGNAELVEMLISRGANVNLRCDGKYTTPLIVASRYNHEATVRLLLKRGADINIQDVGGADEEPFGNAFTVASYCGHESIALLLISKGADINVSGTQWGTALQAASHGGLARVVKLLLEGGLDVNMVRGRLGTALQEASLKGHDSIVEMLLEGGANINAQSKNQQTALQLALANSHVTVARRLLQCGADVNLYGGSLSNALQEASSKGYMTIVKTLLERGASVDAQGSKDGTALQLASSSKNESIVKILLDSGANPDACSEECTTALQRASENGHSNIVRMLLENGADTNLCGGSTVTALQRASSNGHSNIVRMLLDSGANPDVCSEECTTALRSASLNGHSNIVRMLLDSGANPDACSEECTTALRSASLNGHSNIVRMLLENGADTNLCGGSSLTALRSASIRGHEKVVKLLLDGGAEVNAQDEACGTALSSASWNGHEKVVKLLLDGGADANLCRETNLELTSSASDGKGAMVLSESSSLHEGYNTSPNGSYDSFDKYDGVLVESDFDLAYLEYSRSRTKSHKSAGIFNNYGDSYAVYPFYNCSYANLDDMFGDELPRQTKTVSPPLRSASLKGNEAIVRMLLESEADVNACNDQFGTALQAASERGHTAIMRLLIQVGANVNAGRGNKSNALHAALYNSCGEQGTPSETGIRLLLEAGADINARFGNSGSALMAIVAPEMNAYKASTNGCENGASFATWKLLLDAGAVDHDGKALKKAATMGWASWVKALLERSSIGLDTALAATCDPFWRDAGNMGATVELLLKAGAIDRKGTALLKAEISGFEEAAELLRDAAKKRSAHSH